MTEAQRRYMKARQRVETIMLHPATELLAAAAELVAAQQPEIDRLTAELEKAEVTIAVLRGMLGEENFSTTIALEQLWEMLLANHQTQACSNLRRLIAAAADADKHRDDASRLRFPTRRGSDMGRDSSYKKPDETIVTVPLSPELHHRLRVRCVHENITIKAFVTKLLERECP